MAKAPQSRRWIPMLGLGLMLAACGEGDIRVASLPNDAIEVPAEVLRASSAGFRPFATGTTILYLHFDGLVVTKGNKSDAVSGTSFIGGGTVPAFVGDQAIRAQVVTLVKQLYAPYGIQIVTTRPTSGNYDMAVIGGRPASLGLPYPDGPSGGVVGVAPMDCGSAMPRDIAFVFSDSIKSYAPNAYARVVAETTAHESAHTYGLPHSNSGCDLMSYGTCSSLKTFLDKIMGMQDSGSNCGMGSMNSHQLLLKALGPATAPPAATDPPTTTDPPPTTPPTNPPATTPPADTQPPVVRITSPASGAKIEATTKVTAIITDDHGVTKADLLLDGKVVASRTTPPFEFSVSLAPGQHRLAVDAYDAAGNKGTAGVAVAVEQAAGTSSPPAEDPPAADPPPPTDAVPPPVLTPGAFGAACEAPGDCSSGLCADDPASGKYCTEACDAASICPLDSICQPAVGGGNVCATPVTLGASPDLLVGGCSLGSAPAGPQSLWPLLLGLGLFCLGRARRRG